MKKLLVFLSLSACIGLYSCDDASKQPAVAATPLTIEVDTQSIKIDDDEVVTFSVFYGDEDVTEDSQIINITGGGYTPIAGNEFTTLRPGTHTFFAIYGESNSDYVGVNAISENNLSSTFYRRNVAMKFTGTWCHFCPQMTTAIEAASKAYPDRFVEVAMHINDNLESSGSTFFANLFGAQNLPWLVFDMDASYFETMEGVNSLTLVDAAKESLTKDPTVAGIQVETTYENDFLTVDVESTFVADGKYKILVMFTQSGYNYSQSGTNDENYRQNHVLFDILTEKNDGDMLGELVINEKVEKTYEYNLGTILPNLGYELDTTQSKVVVCILKENSGSYFINNAVEASVNETVPYQFEPITDIE